MAHGKAVKGKSSRSAGGTVGSKRKVAVGPEEVRSVRAKTTETDLKRKVTHPSLPKVRCLENVPSCMRICV